MMILSVSRRLPQLLELQRERTWQPLEGVELRDVTVGIVGLGSIGRAVGALATAFGCRVVAVRRRPEARLGRRGRASRRRTASFGEVMLDRVGGPETLPELLGRVGLHRPGRAAHARDRGHDRRRRRWRWSSPGRG